MPAPKSQPGGKPPKPATPAAADPDTDNPQAAKPKPFGVFSGEPPEPVKPPKN